MNLLQSSLASLLLGGSCMAETPPTTPPPTQEKSHEKSSSELADRQDNLAADTQQLVMEQTIDKVIELLKKTESLMDESTDHLEAANTSGETIAIQTEIIEKIYEAAKEKQKQQQQQDQQQQQQQNGQQQQDQQQDGQQQQQNGQPKKGQGSGALMDMLDKMVEGEKNKDKEKENPKSPSEKPGNDSNSENGGSGTTGNSSTPNDPNHQAGSGKSESRRIPKSGGSGPSEIPSEFRKALDAYNRAANPKTSKP